MLLTIASRLVHVLILYLLVCVGDFTSNSSDICDPPCDFGDKGERTGTRAMTRHAKSVIMTRICAYLRSKTKSVTVGFVCLDGVSNVTLNVQLFGMRAKLLACEKTRKQTRDESHN